MPNDHLRTKSFVILDFKSSSSTPFFHHLPLCYHTITAKLDSPHIVLRKSIFAKMRATKCSRGIFLHRLRIETDFGKCTDFCIADSAGQTLITPKLALNVLSPSLKIHTESIIGLGLNKFKIDMFPARVSIELANGVWRTADNVEVGLIPGLSLEDDAHQSGLPMFLGYAAMQALKVAPNMIDKVFIDLAQPSATTGSKTPSSDYADKNKQAMFALKEKDIAEAIEQYKKSLEK